MPSSIVDQCIDFYSSLFEQLFTDRFQPQIEERLKLKAVSRQIDEAADAVSQSLARFFRNERLTEEQAANILEGLSTLPQLLTLEEISNTNGTPESVVERLLTKMKCPRTVRAERQDAVYRVSLHIIVQGLMLIGPVMAEWQNLKFASTFELLNRVIEKLNAITEQLGAPGGEGQIAEDEGYENSYRDYLLQRFYRVEAGTVRMTTNMDVDLRELFVMPRTLPRPILEKVEGKEGLDLTAPMDLAMAREFIRGKAGAGAFQETTETEKQKNADGVQALDQVKRSTRNVIIGLPGSGKSTFFEWLQLKLAAEKETLTLEGGPAIPVLLRVRQFNTKELKSLKAVLKDAALIEKATNSKDRAALMPRGWIERQMKAGRVLLMIDGLDEAEPKICDEYILPWLAEMCLEYPKCSYLVSSRPVGYPPGALQDFGFTECDLLDFGEKEVEEYVKHWCTAIRLAQNEPRKEAKREGEADGEKILADFHRHPYIPNLAQNPLMLSAICLVNHFERGKLPEDRAMLYQLCVEGLLHHWDQRRGIHSEFTLEEKLRTCREVAIAMQNNDRAEYEVNRVQKIFRVTLGNPFRAERLLEHIRYRTGLLIERRAGIFAFAHLTFQEYLAAQAVYEGNKLEIDAERLAKEHSDGRWGEVIALYCGLASAKAARDMIEKLLAQPDTLKLAEILAEAYRSSGPKLNQDEKLRRKLLESILVMRGNTLPFYGFDPSEIAALANLYAGRGKDQTGYSLAAWWLLRHSEFIDEAAILRRIKSWRKMQPMQVAELNRLLHEYGSAQALCELASDSAMYKAPGRLHYKSQAESAFIGLSERWRQRIDRDCYYQALLQTLRTIRDLQFDIEPFIALHYVPRLVRRQKEIELPKDNVRLEIASIIRSWAKNINAREPLSGPPVSAHLLQYADLMERGIAKEKKSATKPGSRTKKAGKKSTGRRK